MAFFTSATSIEMFFEYIRGKFNRLLHDIQPIQLSLVLHNFSVIKDEKNP